jgi:hypothetical protein
MNGARAGGQAYRRLFPLCALGAPRHIREKPYEAGAINPDISPFPSGNWRSYTICVICHDLA